LEERFSDENTFKKLDELLLASAAPTIQISRDEFDVHQKRCDDLEVQLAALKKKSIDDKVKYEEEKSQMRSILQSAKTTNERLLEEVEILERNNLSLESRIHELERELSNSIGIYDTEIKVKSKLSQELDEMKRLLFFKIYILLVFISSCP